jgi:uncharacterized protein (DUF488 family)
LSNGEVSTAGGRPDDLDDRPLHAADRRVLALLAAYRVETIADVRSFPLAQISSLWSAGTRSDAAAHGLGYAWLPALGGRRRRRRLADTAWRNAAFRGYADYMASAEFAQGMAQLLDLASGSRTALMCAEAVWWRCHRSLIADALSVCGIEVVHILDVEAQHAAPDDTTRPHRRWTLELRRTRTGDPVVT